VPGDRHDDAAITLLVELHISCAPVSCTSTITVTGPDAVCKTKCGTRWPRNPQLGIADDAGAGSQRSANLAALARRPGPARARRCAATPAAPPACASPRRRPGWARDAEPQPPGHDDASSTLAAIASHPR
jgi:hypothetical protein